MCEGSAPSVYLGRPVPSPSLALGGPDGALVGYQQMHAVTSERPNLDPKLLISVQGGQERTLTWGLPLRNEAFPSMAPSPLPLSTEP